jgi:hypothetical protein
VVVTGGCVTPHFQKPLFVHNLSNQAFPIFHFSFIRHHHHHTTTSVLHSLLVQERANSINIDFVNFTSIQSQLFAGRNSPYLKKGFPHDTPFFCVCTTEGLLVKLTCNFRNQGHSFFLLPTRFPLLRYSYIRTDHHQSSSALHPALSLSL